MTPDIINIVNAEWLGDYRIRLDFDDGFSQTLGFLPFLQRSNHPAIRACLEHGELVWGDYDLCFPIIDLYHNNIGGEAFLAQAA